MMMWGMMILRRTRSQDLQQDHTLREPAQSKRMCRFHKSHFAQKFTRKIPRPRLSPECRHSLRNRNALQHFTRDIRRATFYRNLKMPLPRFSTSHKRHQKSHFIQKFRGKMPGPRSRGRGHTFDASLRSRNALQHFTRDIRRATLSEIYKKKAAAQIEPRTRGHTLCASLRSRNACPHVTRDIRRAKPLYRKFTGKMPRPRLSPECGRTLCASLPSRNACQDFRRATL